MSNVQQVADEEVFGPLLCVWRYDDFQLTIPARASSNRRSNLSRSAEIPIMAPGRWPAWNLPNWRYRRRSVRVWIFHRRQVDESSRGRDSRPCEFSSIRFSNRPQESTSERSQRACGVSSRMPQSIQCQRKWAVSPCLGPASFPRSVSVIEEASWTTFWH
jgi:hypothetical protein